MLYSIGNLPHHAVEHEKGKKMTSKTGVSLVDHLRRSPVADLNAYMVSRIVVAPDNFGGTPGTSLYALVAPEMWRHVAEAPEYNYSFSLLGLYGELDQLLAGYMAENGVHWIASEPLGIVLGMTGGDEHAELSDDPEARLMAIRMAMAIASEEFGRYLESPKTDFLNLTAQMLGDEPNREFTESEQAKLADELEKSGSLLASALVATTWWQAPEDGTWAQLTVLPDIDPGEMTDEILATAVKGTRHGWNFMPSVNLADEVDEIRRHLARQTTVIVIE